MAYKINRKAKSVKQQSRIHLKIITTLLLLLINHIFQKENPKSMQPRNEISLKLSLHVYLANQKRFQEFCSSQSEINLRLLILLLILSNDISPNPGPRMKENRSQNCQCCNQKLNKHETEIQKCQSCPFNYHLKCIDVSQNYAWICSSKQCPPNYLSNENTIIVKVNSNPFHLPEGINLSQNANLQAYSTTQNRNTPTIAQESTEEEIQNALLLQELPKISSDDYVGKDVCRGCFKEVKPHHHAISCDSCDCWIHQKCSDMSRFTYNKNRTKTSFPWICNICRKDDEAISNKIDPSILSENSQPAKLHDLKNSNEDFTILNINCRSLLNKIEDLNYILNELKPDIVCLTETWLDNSTKENCFIPSGYNIIRKDRSEIFKQKYGRNKGGGIAVVYKNGLKIDTKNYITNKIEEILWVEIKGKQNFLLGVIYRPDYCDLLKDDEEESILEESIRKAAEITQRIIVTGDLNIDMSNPKNKQTEKLTDVFSCFGMNQHIKKPTRIDKSGKETIIDHTWADEGMNLIKKTDTFIALSDHLGTFTSINVPKFTPEKKTILCRCWKKYNKEVFNEKLAENIQKSKLQSNIDNEETDSSMEELSNVIINTLNQIAPMKEFQITQRQSNIPWYTQELHDMITIKKELLSDYYSTKLEYIKNSLKKISNRIGYLKRRLKQNYITEQISEAGNDSKKLWKLINFITNRTNSKQTIEPDFMSQNKANTFNQHFATVGEKIQKELNFQPPSIIFQHDHPGFKFQYEKEETIAKLIDNIKLDVATGQDGISSKIIKDCKETLTPYLTRIVNLSYKHHTFPNKMKHATIKPLYKKEDRNDMGNYRPISILPVLSKIFEKSATNQLVKYFEENNLLSPNQHAYRKGHGTTTCLAEVLNQIHRLTDEKKHCAIVSLDLSKAFDSINHQLLLNKLIKLNLSDTAIKWIHSYLSNRKQKTKFENHVSTEEVVKSGVPQGSIIGPLLFLAFTNDLPKVFQDKCKIVSYADDTQLIVQADNHPMLIKKIEEIIDTAQKWYTTNSMKNNTGKSEILIINSKNIGKLKKINIKVKEGKKTIKIHPKPFIEVLGVKIDQNLNWSKQVASVKKKAFNTIRCIHRVNPMLPVKMRIFLYNTLVTPLLDYADVIWSHCSESQMKSLQRAQSFAVKSIAGMKKYDSTTEAFRKLKFLNLHQRQTVHEATFTLKSLLDINPSHINQEYLKQIPINDRNSIQGKLNLPAHSTTRYEQSPLYKTIKSWNAVPEDIPTHNTKVFKTNFQKYIITQTFNKM